MSSSNVFKACVSILAISAFTACATGPASGNDPKAANQQAQFPKPTPEVIAKINNAPPLEQASFWVKHYNLHPTCLLYTSPSPRDQRGSRMPSSA